MIDKFNIIKFRNTPIEVTLAGGRVIQRQEDVFVVEYKGFVKCAPYSNHFCFEVPKDILGPSYLCSCGGIAVFIGSDAYAHLGSPEGMKLVCQFHTTSGKHADGSS